MIIELVCLDENVEPGPLFFREAPFTIGVTTHTRPASANMKVNCKQCEFYEFGGGLWVRNLGSVEGNSVNGEPFNEARLGSGDMLMLGDIRFRVFFGQELCTLTHAIPALALD